MGRFSIIANYVRLTGIDTAIAASVGCRSHQDDLLYAGRNSVTVERGRQDDTVLWFATGWLDSKD